MRILVVTSYYWPEGFRTTDVAVGLKARGHEVEVLTALPNYPAGRFFDGYGLTGPFRQEHEGIRITRVPIAPRGEGGALGLASNYLSFAVTATLRALTMGGRWDVVFTFQLSPVTTLFPGAVLRAVHGVPLVAWVQDLWPESIASAGFGRSRTVYRAIGALSGWLYRRCDRVLGTSRAFQARLEAMGVAPARYEYLPQWAEELFDDSNGIPPDDAPWSNGFALMFAGNLGRVQALDTVLDAAERLKDDPELRWVFVGDGSRREWLVAEAERRGLADRVFAPGRLPVQWMPAYFATADAMIVSLKPDETMALTVPAKVQSYLAAGRPIIGSIDGEAAKVIEESGAGLAAAAGDAVGLAEIVARLKALPPAERERMGRNGREFSARHFNRERCLDRLEATLVDAARARRR